MTILLSFSLARGLPLKVFLILLALQASTIKCQEIASNKEREIAEIKQQEVHLKQCITLLKQTKKSLKEKRLALKKSLLPLQSLLSSEIKGNEFDLLLLPTETFYHILSFMDFPSLIALEGTARRFNALIDNYWKLYAENFLRDSLFTPYEPACRSKGFKQFSIILEKNKVPYHKLFPLKPSLANCILDLAFNKSGLTTFNIRTREEGEAIIHALPFNSSITSLSIEVSEFLTDYNAVAFFKALQKNESLKELRFSIAKITSEGITAFKRFINNTVTLENLILTGVEDTHARTFAPSLAYTKSLRSLRLCDNKIGPEGAKAIAQALKYNTTITCVNLGHNPLTGKGAKAFAETLLCNSKLEYLYLHWTSLNLEAVEALAMSLSHNTQLKHLDITYKEVAGGSWRLFNQLKEYTERNYRANREKPQA